MKFRKIVMGGEPNIQEGGCTINTNVQYKGGMMHIEQITNWYWRICIGHLSIDFYKRWWQGPEIKLITSLNIPLQSAIFELSLLWFTVEI